MNRYVAAGLFSTAFLLLTGCSPGKGTITGQVTLNGNPVPSGTITFHSESGNKEVFNALVRDGRYSIEGVTPGKATISVKDLGPGAPQELPSTGGNASAAKGGDGRPTPAKKQPPKEAASKLIPARYGDPATSGLSLTVKDGPQTHPVELAP